MSKKEKLITTPNKLTFLSNNHPSHPFEALPSDADWRCDGKEIFGQCKSNINNLFSPFGFGVMRYKCLVCKNFDLCERCLRKKNDAQINNQNEMSFYSQNHSHPLKLCLSEKKWKCDGVTVFGRCKAETRRLPRVKRYKCTKCADFDLCEQCLN
jgi:hypothetical protein